ncbi:hypothetical protein ABH927_003547 [Planotetraspora sp. GP83]
MHCVEGGGGRSRISGRRPPSTARSRHQNFYTLIKDGFDEQGMEMALPDSSRRAHCGALWGDRNSIREPDRVRAADDSQCEFRDHLGCCSLRRRPGRGAGPWDRRFPRSRYPGWSCSPVVVLSCGLRHVAAGVRRSHQALSDGGLVGFAVQRGLVGTLCGRRDRPPGYPRHAAGRQQLTGTADLAKEFIQNALRTNGPLLSSSVPAPPSASAALFSESSARNPSPGAWAPAPRRPPEGAVAANALCLLPGRS